MSRRAESYGKAALAGLLGELAAAGVGQRNDCLNRVSFRAGVLVARGKLELEGARQALEAGGLELGLGSAEVRSTVESGLMAGLHDSSASEAADGRVSHRGHMPAGRRPPAGEVRALWNLARPVGDDPEVSGWLRRRSIPAAKVELGDLVRAIPRGAMVPRWAGCRSGSGWLPWSTCHRVIVRGWGAAGTCESLHARAINRNLAGLPKGMWPAAGAGSAGGLVMAEPLALLLLNGAELSWWERRDVVIAEGLPDFLSWATNYSEADADAPAVFGVTSGSWSAGLASRIPECCRVIVATHLDRAGDRYAARIAETFSGRQCELRRWTQR